MSSSLPTRFISVRPMSVVGGRPISPPLSDAGSDCDAGTRFERQLGDTEVSYFLPSRESGVNDMYLHLGFTAPSGLVEPSRLSLVWAIIRVRHPLLASKVDMIDYNDVRFVYTSPQSVKQALEGANAALGYRKSSKEELLNDYLNGPRTLSNKRLSYIVVSESKSWPIPTPPPTPVETPTSLPSDSELSLPADGEPVSSQNYDILFAAAHFIGDGMALHNFANEFLGLLGNPQLTEDGLRDLLSSDLRSRWEDTTPQGLPPALESGLVFPEGNLPRAVSRVDFESSQAKLIGGHAFPKRSSGPVHTVVPTIPIDKERTKRMLKLCKSHGVSISSVMFALCNLAWARTCDDKRHLPIMLYSAINLRPYLSPAPAKPLKNDSFFFLSIGYFNIVLPSFFPTDKAAQVKTFWHRAQIAKDQSFKAGKSPLIVPRSRLMAEQRAQRARVWAKEDDDKANGISKAPGSTSATPSPPKSPSVCLIGLSLLGNLDGIYKHSAFPDIQLHTLTTGSRQRSGGMLMFAYTFVGMLWVSLGYDLNGFDNDVVQKFWGEVLTCMDEFLLEDV